MKHITEIVGEPTQVSDEAVTVVIRCCGNPKTDSVLTIQGMGLISQQEMLAYIDKHHDKVAAKCRGMASGKQLLLAVVPKTKTHEGI